MEADSWRSDMLNKSFSAKLQKSRAKGGWTLFVIWPDSERIDMALSDSRHKFPVGWTFFER